MGGEVYLAEYGRAKTIHFDLVEVDGVDLRVDAADAGADCIVMTDEANEGTATNDFVDEGTGYSLVLTASEMTGARITVYVVDSATKVWLDKTIHIETFGHLSSAHPFLSPYWTNGAVNDGSASATVWTFDGFTEATADHVIGSELTFTSGANAGQCRTVTDSTSTVITVDPAFLAAPADNDEFVLRAISQTTLGITQAPTIGAMLADVTGIAGSAMRGTDSAALASEVTSTRMSELDDSAGKLVAVADLIKTAADAIKVETDKLTLGDAGAGSAGSIIEEIENRPTTAMRGTDNVVTSGPTKAEMDTAHALLATPTQVNTEVDTAWTTQMADSVSSDGTIATREQALYMIIQVLTEFAISGTTLTVKKVDGSTTLFTETLDDDTNPTSLTRA